MWDSKLGITFSNGLQRLNPLCLMQCAWVDCWSLCLQTFTPVQTRKGRRIAYIFMAVWHLPSLGLQRVEARVVAKALRDIGEVLLQTLCRPQEFPTV